MVYVPTSIKVGKLLEYESDACFLYETISPSISPATTIDFSLPS